MNRESLLQRPSGGAFALALAQALALWLLHQATRLMVFAISKNALLDDSGHPDHCAND